MYCIGDRILYPMHGAGVIESIEEKEILGERKHYYVLKMPCDDMKVMIPVNNVACIGVRSIICSSEADMVIRYFEEYEEEINSNWNKRYRENVARIKSGDIYEVAQVVKTLMCRDKSRGLSSGERKMLSSAKQILISEIVLAQDKLKDDVECVLSAIIEKR